MQSISFTFRADVPPERQNAILADIRAWKGIHQAGRLKPDAKDPVVARMAYAYVEEGAEIEPLVRRLSDLGVTESVQVPAPRKLT